MNVLCHLHIKDNKKTTCRVRDKQFLPKQQSKFWKKYREHKKLPRAPIFKLFFG